ncbi:holin [Pseudoflavonifractor sp. 524-17]|nr:holin [Pseudoflavonifractor sp. 524-17]
MREIASIRNLALAAAAAAGSWLAGLLGGWDTALQTLVVCMAADYITGVAVAGVFRRSGKSRSGALDSRAGFQGLCRKGAELMLVLAAAQLDGMLRSGGYARTAVLLFFIANEGLSILENLGIMGVPYPACLRAALEVLRQQGDEGKSR